MRYVLLGAALLIAACSPKVPETKYAIVAYTSDGDRYTVERSLTHAECRLLETTEYSPANGYAAMCMREARV